MTDIGSTTPQRNQVLPTFLNMPLNVANLVLEKMEPMDLLKASKVCRSLKTAVDEFGLRFGYIGLNLRKDRVRIWWWGETEIIYTTAANGSTNVIHNEQANLIDGENFVERALKDLMILSKHGRRIEIANFTEERCDIVKTFNEILNTGKCILVKEIALRNFSFDEVFTILPCFDAKKLKKIVLLQISSIDQFERITHLEQWKNAEVFIINSHKCTIASTMIAHFFHFKFFRIYQMDEFPAQTAIQIRDDLLRRSTFQSCKIYFDRSKSNPIDIAKVFKPDYAGGNEFKLEFSSGNNKFNILLEDLQYHSNHFKLNVKRL